MNTLRRAAFISMTRLDSWENLAGRREADGLSLYKGKEGSLFILSFDFNFDVIEEKILKLSWLFPALWELVENERQKGGSRVTWKFHCNERIITRKQRKMEKLKIKRIFKKSIEELVRRKVETQMRIGGLRWLFGHDIQL